MLSALPLDIQVRVSLYLVVGYYFRPFKKYQQGIYRPSFRCQVSEQWALKPETRKL